MNINIEIDKDALAALNKKAGIELSQIPKVTRVLFSGRATIVFFDDGTKSVAKCNECGLNQGFLRRCHREAGEIAFSGCRWDGYSKERGVTVAIAKRMVPNWKELCGR